MVLLSGLTAVLCAGGAGVYWLADLSLTRQFDEMLRTRAQTLASLVKFEPESLVFESGDAPPAMVAETYFELRTHSGRVLKRSANLGEAGLLERAPAEHEWEFANATLPASVDGRMVWMTFRPRMDPDDWEGHSVDGMHSELLVVAAAMDRAPIDGALSSLLAALCVAGALIALAAGLLVSAGVRWGLAPLENLTRQIGKLGCDDASVRFLSTAAPSELLPVYRELNNMLGRVEQTIERERLFIDAAAHELRTPLAELRTLGEVALKWPDAQRAVDALTEAMAIGHEMERIVESLLLISRGHASTVDASSAVKPISPFVQECLDRAAPDLRAKRVSVSVDFDGVQDVQRKPAANGAVEFILRNLIENAVHYTPPGGRISIRGNGALNGTPWLVVENGPVHLSALDVSRLFEPFWRGDTARVDRKHAGLGLAVVQQIALAVGMHVDAMLSNELLQMRVFDGNQSA
jgi:signal transduction histidine kinase